MPDVAIVLGSGLADATLARIDGTDVPYRKLHAPKPRVPGHAGIARIGTWADKRVVAFAGRPHLYEGYDPHEVAFLVRLAAASGAHAVVITNAAGALSARFRTGDVVAISDHINLTGATPLAANDEHRFVVMADAYSADLRRLARGDGAGNGIGEAVYAGVRGPQYETLAEAEALRRLGAELVGMSTVLETIAARSLGLDVLGLSLVTNVIGAAGGDVAHEEVLAVAKRGSTHVADIIERVLARL